jgi:hypothetical protein
MLRFFDEVPRTFEVAEAHATEEDVASTVGQHVQTSLS